MNSKQTRRWPWVVVGVVALGACSSSATPAATEPGATAAEATELPSADAVFALGMTTHGAEIDAAAGLMSEAGEAAGAMDVSRAVAAARAAGEGFDELTTVARGLPGAASATGVVTIEAFEQCATANHAAADAMAAVDVTRIQAAAADLGRCGEVMALAAEVVEAAAP